MILRPDDLQKGMYVTVLEWLPYEKTCYDLMTGGIQTITNHDNSYTGDVLRVEAINLPYIVCLHLSRYSHNIYPIDLDLRRVKLTILSQEYVNTSLMKNEKEIK